MLVTKLHHPVIVCVRDGPECGVLDSTTYILNDCVVLKIITPRVFYNVKISRELSYIWCYVDTHEAIDYDVARDLTGGIWISTGNQDVNSAINRVSVHKGHMLVWCMTLIFDIR